MAGKHSSLTYRWMEEVWNKGREEAIDDLMHENALVHGIDDVKEHGTAAFKQFFRNFREQFPEVHVEVEEVVAEGDVETARCTVNATTAAGQKASFAGMTFTRFVDGKIAEGWNNFDFLNMYTQLGFKMAPAVSLPA